MAEHGLDEQVIGVSFDGTGYGDDGNIWGGEFFICDLNAYERVKHFEYIPIPGGDKAIKEPWRMGLSYLYRSMGDNIWDLDIPLMRFRPRSEMELVAGSISKSINAPLSSSAGRLFDAVSAITGLVYEATFHAEAPMRLEAAIREKHSYRYAYTMDNKTISFTPMIDELVEDIMKNKGHSYIALKFHNTIIEVIVNTVKQIAPQYGLKKVVLSGGTFQNKFILSGAERLLLLEGYEVYSQQKVPSNDGGIALGQISIASKRKELKCV
jgi:hydrogenase maturation protein HypF